MRFKWYDPTGYRVHEEYIYKTGNVYESTYYPTDMEGEWKVSVSEISSDYELKDSDAYFYVSSLPEFTLGSFIAVLFAGIVYFSMRKNMAGFFNEN
ncbi:MAG: hypothetical protein R2741_12865 [Methanolobus sp.]